MNEVGLFAMHAGDLATAGEYLPLAIRHYRDAGDTPGLAIVLENLTDCLGYLGQVGPARDAGAEAVACAKAIGDSTEIVTAHSEMGKLASLVGDTAEAEEHFLAADQIHWPSPGGRARPWC